nr:uncharacterized protein LOC113807160 isoform X3 [Penaeus vannamei]
MKGPVATLKPEEGPRFIGPDTPIDSWPSVYIKEELLESADNNNSNSPDPLKTSKVELGEGLEDQVVAHTDLSDGEARVEVSSSTNGAVAVNTSPAQHDSFLALCGDANDQPQDVCGDNGRVTPVDREIKLSPAARNSPEFVSTYIQQLDNYPAAQPPPPQWYSYSSSQWAPYGYLPRAADGSLHRQLLRPAAVLFRPAVAAADLLRAARHLLRGAAPARVRAPRLGPSPSQPQPRQCPVADPALPRLVGAAAALQPPAAGLLHLQLPDLPPGLHLPPGRGRAPRRPHDALRPDLALRHARPDQRVAALLAGAHHAPASPGPPRPPRPPARAPPGQPPAPRDPERRDDGPERREVRAQGSDEHQQEPRPGDARLHRALVHARLQLCARGHLRALRGQVRVLRAPEAPPASPWCQQEVPVPRLRLCLQPPGQPQKARRRRPREPQPSKLRAAFPSVE